MKQTIFFLTRLIIRSKTKQQLFFAIVPLLFLGILYRAIWAIPSFDPLTDTTLKAQMRSFAHGQNPRTTETNQFFQKVEYVQNEMLIQYKPFLHSLTARAVGVNHGLVMQRDLNNTLPNEKGPLQLVKLRKGENLQQKIKELESNSLVEYAQPNYIYHAFSNDTRFADQWGLKNTGQTIASPTYKENNPGTAGKDIDIEKAWQINKHCDNFVTAVIDSGINYNQEDLAGNMASGSYSCPNNTVGQYGCDFVGTGGNDPMDKSGHGTHVAGIIGAIGNNNKGLTGVCQKAKILAVKVLDTVGSGTTADIVEGLNFAIGTNSGQGKAKIVNMSLGGKAEDTAFQNAVTAAKQKGVLLVVAAGNDREYHFASGSVYPCDYTNDNIICVGAVDQKYQKASFSDFSETHIDIFAPGTNILSTYNGSFTYQLLTPRNATEFASWNKTPADGFGFKDSCSLGNTPLNNFIQSPSTAGNEWCKRGNSRANTDHQIWKTFDFTGNSIVVFNFFSFVNLIDKQTFEINYKAANEEPFTSGTSLFSIAGKNIGAIRQAKDISTCNTTNCSIGFRLKNTNRGYEGYVGAAILSAYIKKGNLDSTTYELSNGTSMASPMVTGIAALVWQKNPNYSYKDIRNAIKIGGDYEVQVASSATSGNNVADAYKALLYLPETTGVTITNN